LATAQTTAEAAVTLFQRRQPCLVTYADWRQLDALEVARGQEKGRPRVKFTRVADMLAALGKE
jgi:ferredoxin--NADP+ reductase